MATRHAEAKTHTVLSPLGSAVAMVSLVYCKYNKIAFCFLFRFRESSHRSLLSVHQLARRTTEGVAELGHGEAKNNKRYVFSFGIFPLFYLTHARFEHSLARVLQVSITPYRGFCMVLRRQPILRSRLNVQAVHHLGATESRGSGVHTILPRRTQVTSAECT